MTICSSPRNINGNEHPKSKACPYRDSLSGWTALFAFDDLEAHTAASCAWAFSAAPFSATACLMCSYWDMLAFVRSHLTSSG